MFCYFNQFWSHVDFPIFLCKWIQLGMQKNEGKTASDVWVPGMTRNPETYVLKDQVSDSSSLVCMKGLLK